MEYVCRIRCVTCGNVLAHRWAKFKELLSQRVPIEEALNSIRLRDYCCRRTMLNPFHIPLPMTKESEAIVFGQPSANETNTEQLTTLQPPKVITTRQAATIDDLTISETPALTTAPAQTLAPQGALAEMQGTGEVAAVDDFGDIDLDEITAGLEEAVAEGIIGPIESPIMAKPTIFGTHIVPSSHELGIPQGQQIGKTGGHARQYIAH